MNLKLDLKSNNPIYTEQTLWSIADKLIFHTFYTFCDLAYKNQLRFRKLPLIYENYDADSIGQIESGFKYPMILWKNDPLLLELL